MSEGRDVDGSRRCRDARPDLVVCGSLCPGQPARGRGADDRGRSSSSSPLHGYEQAGDLAALCPSAGPARGSRLNPTHAMQLTLWTYEGTAASPGRCGGRHRDAATCTYVLHAPGGATPTRRPAVHRVVDRRPPVAYHLTSSRPACTRRRHREGCSRLPPDAVPRDASGRGRWSSGASRRRADPGSDPGGLARWCLLIPVIPLELPPPAQENRGAAGDLSTASRVPAPATPRGLSHAGRPATYAACCQPHLGPTAAPASGIATTCTKCANCRHASSRSRYGSRSVRLNDLARRGRLCV